MCGLRRYFVFEIVNRKPEIVHNVIYRPDSSWQLKRYNAAGE